jgi:hypothetical protein
MHFRYKSTYQTFDWLNCVEALCPASCFCLFVFLRALRLTLPALRKGLIDACGLGQRWLRNLRIRLISLLTESLTVVWVIYKTNVNIAIVPPNRNHGRFTLEALRIHSVNWILFVYFGTHMANSKVTWIGPIIKRGLVVGQMTLDLIETE